MSNSQGETHQSHENNGYNVSVVVVEGNGFSCLDFEGQMQDSGSKDCDMDTPLSQGFTVDKKRVSC